MKRILIISPRPSHPHNAGNRIRIFGLASQLEASGHEVYFLYAGGDSSEDDSLMRRYWQDRYIAVPRSASALQKIRARLGALRSKLSPSRQMARTRQSHTLDSLYDSRLDEELKMLADAVKFDVILVQYVFMSKALDCFDDGLLKIIDTQDIFGNRNDLYVRHGIDQGWFSTSEEEETRGLSRADIVIAITEDDRKHFANLVDRTVITVGHIVPIHEHFSNRTGCRDILFVGSSNPINVQGITHFIESTLPLIHAKVPDARLTIVGSVCDAIRPNIRLECYGFVEDLAPVYRQADVVVNPVLFGTGLSIKTIEAFGHSKPVVSTSAGMRGLHSFTDRACVQADSAPEFAEAVIRLLTNDELRQQMARSAVQITKQWNEDNTRILTDILDSTPVENTGADMLVL